jgi:hypothetical protein
MFLVPAAHPIQIHHQPSSFYVVHPKMTMTTMAMKRVSFDENVRVRLHLHVSGMTDEEVGSYWYSRNELRKKRSSSKNLNKYASDTLSMKHMQSLMTTALSVVHSDGPGEQLPPMADFLSGGPAIQSDDFSKLRRKNEFPWQDIENSPGAFLMSPTKLSKRKWLKQQPK